MADDIVVYLGLGSNISPEENIPRAVELLKAYLNVQATSTAWESPAVECVGPNFFNAVVQVLTPLAADELKNQVIRPIESQLGRVRTAYKHSPRTIDIDILMVDGQIMEPAIWTLAHLAVPMSEMLPTLAHLESGVCLLDIAKKFRRAVVIIPCPQVLKRGKFLEHRR